MNRQDTLVKSFPLFGAGAALCSAGLLTSCIPDAAKPDPPNIVIIITDDQGWGDISLHGNTNLHTPHIDAIAQNGAQFTNFYVQPVCSPTRADLLTGRYHTRTGVFDTSEGGERMNLNETTFADIFRQAGYATAAFGKWHNGMQYPYHPNGRGFDEFYGFCSGHWGDYFSPPLEHNGKIVQGEGYVPDDITTRAIDFMRARDGRPHGNIVRSNRWPNSSFFTNWTSTNDKITWNVEVLEEGWFEAEIYYTCPSKDAGSTFELSFGNSTVTGKITEGHDPPLRGMENDRVKRMESYVKDFRPLPAETIFLEKGMGEITLKATEITGSQVMDLRLLMLTRIIE